MKFGADDQFSLSDLPFTTTHNVSVSLERILVVSILTGV